MSDPWRPLVVTVAPNGAYKNTADHPALPLTPKELARTAAACREAGAAMVHLHVRDARGGHSLDAEAYRTAIDAIRHEVGDALVIQATSESAGRYGPEEQMSAVRALRPEAVSLAVREIVPDEESEPEAARFLDWLAAERTMVQYILYSPGDLERFSALRGREVIPDRPCMLLFVLGRYATGQVSSPRDLVPFLAGQAPRAPWAVCAFGAREHACVMAAAALGGHARVGFENNLVLRDGSPAPDNAALVAQVTEGARALGRPVADADDLRALYSG